MIPMKLVGKITNTKKPIHLITLILGVIIGDLKDVFISQFKFSTIVL
jgi:hypothetical protein